VANGPGKDTADDVVVMVTELRPADSEDTRPIHLPLTWSGTSPPLTVSAVHPGSARHIDLLHVDMAGDDLAPLQLDVNPKPTGRQDFLEPGSFEISIEIRGRNADAFPLRRPGLVGRPPVGSGRDVGPSSCRATEESTVTRFVIDCETLLRIVAGEVEVAAGHQLVAPTLVRSQALAALYEAARRSELSVAEGIERVTRINSLKIRFLGDKVLQRTAWRVADQLGWETTFDAEFVALTQLQADVFVTSDGELARAVSGLVETATIDALSKA
jgi:predicted nucleic acid-binding protein